MLCHFGKHLDSGCGQVPLFLILLCHCPPLYILPHVRGNQIQIVYNLCFSCAMHCLHSEILQPLTNLTNLACKVGPESTPVFVAFLH